MLLAARSSATGAPSSEPVHCNRGRVGRGGAWFILLIILRFYNRFAKSVVWPSNVIRRVFAAIVRHGVVRSSAAVVVANIQMISCVATAGSRFSLRGAADVESSRFLRRCGWQTSGRGSGSRHFGRPPLRGRVVPGPRELVRAVPSSGNRGHLLYDRGDRRVLLLRCRGQRVHPLE